MRASCGQPLPEAGKMPPGEIVQGYIYIYIYMYICIYIYI